MSVNDRDNNDNNNIFQYCRFSFLASLHTSNVADRRTQIFSFNMDYEAIIFHKLILQALYVLEILHEVTYDVGLHINMYYMALHTHTSYNFTMSLDL